MIKHVLKLLAILVAIFALAVSCEKPGEENSNGNKEQTDNNEEQGGPEGEGELAKLKGITLKVEEVNVTDVYFTGTVKQMTPDIVVGVYWDYYPIEHISDTHIKSTTDFYEGKFAFHVSPLPSNSTIYYMPYVHRNGVTEYGDCLSFKTATPTMSVDDIEVYASHAILTGVADLDDGRGGILYSTNNNISLDNYMIKFEPDTRYEDDKAYTHILTDLQIYTTYYYRTYYWDGGLGKYVYGDLKSFTTRTNPYTSDAIKNLSLSSAKDLSADGTSNCYIVSKSGLYKIKAVKGNDSSEILSNASQPAIVWESFGTDVAPDFMELISGVCYKDGYLIFQTSSIFKEGNAVIAVKDENDNILWSWHIWMTDKPQEHVYKNNAGILMDRNLGATSATPGDVGALGLLYQWGRKDPFLGSSSISSNVKAKSTMWESVVRSDSQTGKIEYTISHPTTFITCNTWNYDWYCTGGQSTENDGWRYYSKSIYDPCPPGWRVPKGGDDGVWYKGGFGDAEYDEINKGISFSIISPSTAWYPAAGCLSSYYNRGSLESVATKGSYWSATPYNGKHYNAVYSLRFTSTEVTPSHYYNDFRSEGFSVRCIKE